MPAPTKTTQVRIELPEDLHAKLSQEANEDERTLSVYIVRVLRGLKPRANAPIRQPAVIHPLPVHVPTSHTLDIPELPSHDNPLAEPLAPSDDLPIEQWDDERLVSTIVEKRTASQNERARIATIGPKEAEQAKAELEHALAFIGVLERELNKRRGKQPRKAPQPPRENVRRVS